MHILVFKNATYEETTFTISEPSLLHALNILGEENATFWGDDSGLKTF